ncbi:hypothetical protein FOQG_06575 [Fusarium oxysporum f. sp. raphani 54005]|uniref:Uncharacterized protein n=2 Tax=Fusarium oxysporum TaxID=5507 RepID=X0D8X8_FUSOX|nr:hypothetical protein FOVG_06287 [Fusarium oxysporum f. sp. pisi HDV247]EXA45110.1 hypothetical protein FOVG_06287 [Fusarium oxysporum f. sp. pisi HDV247]EXA45111.1 hypothetical protein FOVG_06287 [Fusarium oxysporum f. sp. pisi HDV247]EXK91062.1 hypothetical protein FOQG_06575 [Fusarium oxysporum f. sp. raphani 54005]EXK91063.1 hypothetical protein FOQG_06575 [Fusarium oxysporum f. sp. raphani 54005]
MKDVKIKETQEIIGPVAEFAFRRFEPLAHLQICHQLQKPRTSPFLALEASTETNTVAYGGCCFICCQPYQFGWQKFQARNHRRQLSLQSQKPGVSGVSGPGKPRSLATKKPRPI